MDSLSIWFDFGVLTWSIRKKRPNKSSKSSSSSSLEQNSDPSSGANKVLNSVNAQAETDSYSVHTSYAELYKYLLDACQAVAKFITAIEGDVWDNEDLKKMVEAYFEDTIKTLEFFNSVDKLADKASIGDLYLQRAVDLFDKESAENGGNTKNKYEKALEDLKKFENMKHDFDGDKLIAKFASVKKEQENLLEQVSDLKKKIDAAYAAAQAHSKLTNILFGVLFGVVALIGVATFAFGGDALVAGAIAAGLSLPVVAVGWAGTKIAMQKLEDTVKKQKDIAEQVGKGLEVNKDAMATIMNLVENLLDKIESMLEIADTPDEASERDTKNELKLIKKKLGGFTDSINEVDETVAKLSKLVVESRIKKKYIVYRLWMLASYTRTGLDLCGLGFLGRGEVLIVVLRWAFGSGLTRRRFAAHVGLKLVYGSIRRSFSKMV
ncbi:hypothetical protein Bca4012_102741 [Brassica carinata]